MSRADLEAYRKSHAAPGKALSFTAACGHVVESWQHAQGLCDECIAQLPPLKDDAALAGVPASHRRAFERSRRRKKR